MFPGSFQGFKQYPENQGEKENVFGDSFVDIRAFKSVFVCWEGRRKRRGPSSAISKLVWNGWCNLVKSTRESGIQRYAHNVPTCHAVSGLTCSNVCWVGQEAVEVQAVLV